MLACCRFALPLRPRLSRLALGSFVMSEYAFVHQPQIIRETAEANRLDIRDEMLDQRELELMTRWMLNLAPSSSAACFTSSAKIPRCLSRFISTARAEVQSGLALYDVMQAVSCPIRTVCLGMAASMGALFIAGDEREILPHSRIMIHPPSRCRRRRQRAFRESPGRRPHAHPRHHGQRHRAAQRHVDRARLRAYGLRHLFLRSGRSRRSGPCDRVTRL